MVAIESYTNATEAYTVKTLLESHGIRCELKDDLISAQPIGKIELFVDAKNVSRARDVLANAGEDNER